MKRLAPLLFLPMFGCSTSPLVDMQDYFKKPRMYRNQVDPYGGVCAPQGQLPGLIGTAQPVVPFPAVPPPLIAPGAGPVPAPPPPPFGP